MKILLLGANGQLGKKLNKYLSKIGEVKSCGKSEVNLENFLQAKEVIHDFQPKIIVNAAAYTNVDLAETEPKKANIINSEAPAILAQEANKINALLIHYSTDYVFDGTKTDPYNEDDITNPLSIYGKTKLLGENAITKSGCKYLIFRTSWVYDLEGNNFVNRIIKLAKERDTLAIINDQIGVPTSADYIADITAKAILNQDKQKYGIYHLVPEGKTSWYGIAKFVMSTLENKGVKFLIASNDIQPIFTEEYPLPAVRPKNSRLNTTKLQEKFNISAPNWQHHLKLMLEKYIDV